MLVQYKLDSHGYWYENKPSNCFEQYYGRLPGFVTEGWIMVHELGKMEIPKYILHVVDAFIIHHPKLPNIKTRYLKCFITIPEHKDVRSVYTEATEPETKLGYVREEWVEPLEETEYIQALKIRSKELAAKYLAKLKG